MEKMYLRKMIELANKAYSLGEIPVGAIVVKNGKIIGEGYNKKEMMKNPLKHAEIIAIEEACIKNNDWRLSNCDIYVTMKPCNMCLGLIKETRIKNVYYILDKDEQSFNTNIIKIQNTELEEYYLQIIQSFFKKLRNK